MEATDVDAFFARLEAMEGRVAWPLLQLVDGRLAAAKARLLAATDLKRHGHRMAAEAHTSKGALVGQAKDAALLVKQPRVLDELAAGRRSPRQALDLATSLAGVAPDLADDMAAFVLANLDPTEPPRAHRTLARALVDQCDDEAARRRRAQALAGRRGVTVEPLDDDLARLVYVDRADLVDATFTALRRRCQAAGDPRDREGGWAGALADEFFETVTQQGAHLDAWPAPARGPVGVPSEELVDVLAAAVAPPEPAAASTRASRPTGPTPGRWRNAHLPPPAIRAPLVLICHRRGDLPDDLAHDLPPDLPGDDPGGALPETRPQPIPKPQPPPTHHRLRPTRRLDVPRLVVPGTGAVRLVASSDGHGDLDPAGGELLGVGAVHHVSRDLVRAYLELPGTRVRHVEVWADGRYAEPPPWTDPDTGDPSHAMREHIRLRDRTCRWPGCDVPAARTDAEHLQGRHRGTTRCDCLLCLCNTHHQGGRHIAGTSVSGSADATVTIRLADGSTFYSRPAVVDPATRYSG